MKLFSQDSKERTSNQVPPGSNSISTLDASKSQTTFWSERTFEFDDLLLKTTRGEDDLLLISFKLQRVGVADSGKNQNPVSKTLLLSFKAEKKEVALLTGLLGRQLQVEEELRPSFRAKEEMSEDLERLREENEELQSENLILKRSLMEIQRPRRVS